MTVLNLSPRHAESGLVLHGGSGTSLWTKGRKSEYPGTTTRTTGKFSTGCVRSSTMKSVSNALQIAFYSVDFLEDVPALSIPVRDGFALFQKGDVLLGNTAFEEQIEVLGCGSDAPRACRIRA